MPQVFNRDYVTALPPEQAVEVYLEPAVNANNPLQNALGLWEWAMGKDKHRMLHLSVNRNNLQKRTNCSTWNPTVSAGMRGETIEVTDFELNGEQCPDEFEVGYMRELSQPLGSATTYFRGTAEQQALQAAIVRGLSRNLSDDIYKILYFGDKNLQARIDAGVYGDDPYPSDPVQRAQMIHMLSQMDGIWTEIEARTRATGQGSIRYVSTNDGTIAGNAMRPENVVEYFKSLKAAASPQLKRWRDQTNQVFQKPVFLVQDGIFEAYKEYLRTQNNTIGHQFILDSEPVEDVLRFDGHLVILVPEWEMHDAEMGRISSDGQNIGYSNNQRALFTVLRNFTGVANMTGIEADTSNALVVQQSPLIQDKGKTYMYAAYGFGVGVAQPDLVVAGYASSATYL